ncbi:hypothetical protein [Pseudomonas baltica]|uniref:hypothetical protein n=1 Tax=Pseudomonas baltica TaxID=2762576 RepID=UPI0028A0966E|nr:hypothetical protein [Pseudomonas baltica]
MHAHKNASTTVDLEYEQLSFSPTQTALLAESADRIAAAGGPELPGAIACASAAALRLYRSFNAGQRDIVRRYSDGHLAVLECSGLLPPRQDPPPSDLPPLHVLENAPECLHLAARNQILLHLVKHRAFAYDMDNNARLIRFVGNFCGGGLLPRADEPPDSSLELSSHAGLPLGPHTEAPYHCAIEPLDGHSPAPSTLILTARWNPLGEPTCIIPMTPVIDRIGARAALALTSASFDYTRSDSFVTGSGSSGQAVSILQFDVNGGYALRYNSYRYSLNENASPAAIAAFQALNTQVRGSEVIKIALTASNALLINNYRALHCRDIIRDNRRLLIRLFGYSRFVSPIVLNADPLKVQG